MFQSLIKLLNADPQSPGFLSASSAHGHLHGIGVNAISRLFAFQASRASLFLVVLHACFAQ
jgi:hypothetical protein